MRRMPIILILLSICASLFASPELWLDVGLSSGRDYVSDTFKNELKSKNPSIYTFSSGKEFINNLGPYMNLVFFPSDHVRIGVNAGVGTNFTIGFSDGGSVGSTFRRFDFRQDVKAGISYYQLFGNIGIFTDLDFNMAYYHIGLDPKENTKTAIDYYSYRRYSISADLGLIQRFNNGFFKFGFLFDKPVFNNDNSGWSLEVIASGGYIF